MSCQNPQRYYPVLGDTRVLGWCEECVDVMNQIGYPIKDIDWRVTKKPVASWYGMAYKKINMVILNSKLLEEEENAVKNTILHELAHIAAPEYSHHGYEWQCICEKIRRYTGQVITRTNPFSQHAAVKAHRDAAIRYEFVCPECGCHIRKIRRTRFVDEYDQLANDGGPKWWCARCRKTTGKKVAFHRIK